MSKSWSSVRLGEVLKPRVERMAIDPVAPYKEVTVRLWGKGVIERGTATGAAIAATGRYKVKFRDFVLSKIDARNGALGIVPKSLDGALVSGDFPVFEANQSRMLPEYIGWLCKTAGFVESCRQASEGTTNRVRLKLDRFLSSEIPLPPLDEQKRIVAYLDTLSTKITQARTLRHQSTQEAEALLPAELHRRFVAVDNTWPWATVGDAGEIIDPNPSHRMPRYAESGVPFISTVDFEGTEGIRRRTAKYVERETYIEQLDRCKFAPGDILYSRIGTIGEARELTEVWPFALSHVLVVVKPKKGVLPRFLLWYLRSDSIVTQAAAASRSVGVPDLGIKRIRTFRMPFPSLSDQRLIVAELDALQAQVDALKRLQAETAAELTALQSAALDRAFKGEL